MTGAAADSSATNSRPQRTPKKVVNASPKKAVSKPKSPKAKAKKDKGGPSNHPTYISMIKSTITELKQPKGISRIAMLKYIMDHFEVGDSANKVNSSLKLALKRGIETGELKQVKGIGASGSFKLGGGTPKTLESQKKKIIVKKAAVMTAAKTASPKTIVKPKAQKKAAAAAKKPKSADSPAAAAPPKPKTAKSMKKVESPKNIVKEPLAPKKAVRIAKKAPAAYKA